MVAVLKHQKKILGIAVLVASIFILGVSLIIYSSDNKVSSSVENGIAAFSPRGVFGGVIIPASCESGYEHTAGECVPPLVCSPSSQNAEVNERVIFTASGGTGNYAWQASQGNLITAREMASVSYSSTGTKTVNLSSGDETQICQAVVGPASTSTISCAPSVTSWSSCSASCGGGTEARIVTAANCGTTRETRNCNSNPCVGGIAPGTPSCTFSANPSSVVPPQPVTLSWSCSNTASSTSCVINQGIGNVPIDGTRSVNPSRTTTYTLTCDSWTGSKTVSVGIIPRIIECIADPIRCIRN